MFNECLLGEEKKSKERTIDGMKLCVRHFLRTLALAFQELDTLEMIHEIDFSIFSFCNEANIVSFSFSRISGLGWVIILREKNGKEYIMEHIDLSINDSSVTIMWYGKPWPRLATLSTLDLCGVTPVFMDQSKTPSKNG